MSKHPLDAKRHSRSLEIT